MLLLDGKTAAAALKERLKGEIAALAPRAGRSPGLAVILVGEDPASQIYVRNKAKACQEVGIRSEALFMPDSTSRPELTRVITELNERPDIDGILLQLPLPAGLDSHEFLSLISPDKDVDGFHPQNMGRLVLGLPGPRPCTPAGIMALMDHYGLSARGKVSVIIGRSNIVGRPLSIMLSANGPTGDSTVILCHSRTPDLPGLCRQADFVFAALGRPKFVTRDMVKPGAVVIDVGINRTEHGLVGDADFENLTDLAEAMTPVPGGIGPMTIALLLRNTFESFTRRVSY